MTRPQITATTHTLPFDKLSPPDFERLCLWLVKREGWLRPEHLGAAGSEQGRDEGGRWPLGMPRAAVFFSFLR